MGAFLAVAGLMTGGVFRYTAHVVVKIIGVLTRYKANVYFMR
jgi:hypothetical protein